MHQYIEPMRKAILIPVYIILFTVFNAAAADIKSIGVPYVQNYTKAIYQSGNQNWAVTRDEHGIMYFGNSEGLLAFDGKYWQSYPMPNGLIVRSVANGWALNGTIKNGNSYFGIKLPLGPAEGGPLFFAHYSFLGINPNGLSDAYAGYDVQNKAHALINYNYCISNPKGYYGYSNVCWGLTASDIENGYTASSPTNDVGVIAPTAAISSLPYTPTQSMQALKFFYYKLGDKMWGQYGFYDAFNLNNTWFASSTLAIDQGPIIDMIENYRSGLLWNLFMSCPEVKNGMKNLGFQSPNL